MLSNICILYVNYCGELEVKNHQAYALHILLCIIHVQTKPCYICQHKLPLLTIFGAGTLYGKKRGGGEED